MLAYYGRHGLWKTWAMEDKGLCTTRDYVRQGTTEDKGLRTTRVYVRQAFCKVVRQGATYDKRSATAVRKRTNERTNAYVKLNVNQNENEKSNATGEDTYGGALRAPLAGFPACVSVFVFVLIYV